ncbi:hypothetical protein [Candidatus Nitrosotenuis aquarius]|uniref:hypothetical protein n=1 Tax=Candidatus Nitrosotenuis aquarius TaxID=1846278 RepID=UPI000C1EEDFD|nr:hypothetical protein [Candidatus Nitrosotenuis aquarius]
MNKKIVLASIATIIVFGIGISVSQSISVQQKYQNLLYLDGTFYPEKKLVEITFTDKTQKTTNVVLEILGMEKSFQRTFDGHSFTITVPFEEEPQYGWKVVPITLVVNHPEFGKVGVKTDIHDVGKSSSTIFTQL